MINSVPNVNTTASLGAQWLQWGNYHRQVFGWKSDSDVEMLALWIGIFRKWEFTPAEMIKATESLLRRETPPFKREDHINHLRTAVFAQRDKTYSLAAVAEDYSRGTCVYCYNSGLATVPLLADIVGIDWVTSKTCAVWCTCNDGLKYAVTKTEDGRKLMGLLEYKTRNPNYKQQIELKFNTDKEISHMQAAGRESTAGANLDILDATMAKILSRYGA